MDNNFSEKNTKVDILCEIHRDLDPFHKDLDANLEELTKKTIDLQKELNSLDAKITRARHILEGFEYCETCVDRIVSRYIKTGYLILGDKNE